MEMNKDFQKQKKDMEISARRWKTTYGESDNFDLLFTYQYAKKQRIWKYRQEDEKQQMVEVTILIYGVHAIISFSINTCTKTRKATMVEVTIFDLLFTYQDAKKQPS